MEAIHRGEIKGLLSICFNPLVSLPDANFTREALEKLEFFGVIDFFMSETARHADVVLAGSLQEEEEGVACNVEGRVIHIQQAVDAAGRCARRFARSSAIWRGGWATAVFSLSASRARSSRSCARHRAAGIADYYGITYEKIDRQMGVFWPCPSLDHPGTPRLFEGGRFFHPDGKARFMSRSSARVRRSGGRAISRST